MRLRVIAVAVTLIVVATAVAGSFYVLKLFTARLAAISDHIATLSAKQGEVEETILHNVAPRDCIPIETLPAVVATPGTYCLTANLVFASAGDAITVNADNVTIDGRGFEISGPTDPATTSRGVLAINRSDLTVRDIIISGFSTSVIVGNTDAAMPGTATFYDPNRLSRNITVENVTSYDATLQGIHIRADNFRIVNNRVSAVGPSQTADNNFATGIYTLGNGCEISGNLIMLGEATGTGENVGIGVNLGAGCEVANNTVVFDRLPEFGRNFGIWTRPAGGELALVRDNFITGSHHALGPFGIFKNNIATNTVCDMFARRPSAVDILIDLGGNRATASGLLPQIGSTTCFSDPEAALSRFESAPSAAAAYTTALAFGETDPVDLETETRTWLIVAARLGHQKAIKEIALFPDDAMTRTARQKATEILEE